MWVCERDCRLEFGAFGGACKVDSELPGFGVGLEDTQTQDRRKLKAGGLWRGGLPAPALPEGCDPLGVAPEPSRVLTFVLQSVLTGPRLPSTPLLSTRGSARSDSASAIPSGFYKAPAGPFGKRISFFLDAFPDLGATEGLCAGSRCSLAWGRRSWWPGPPEHCCPGPFRSNPQLPPRSA